eukprot:TRINITY_DN5696_c0_g1_i12.p3 TRINITY_DN5696_c0_g1~~TRINITY_DN5696_c0_g1_i12.p3  ORF type:complete len:234 (+),score=31.17 TRINITY_DN5696_c0_g1_i12:3806-4507(+)
MYILTSKQSQISNRQVHLTGVPFKRIIGGSGTSHLPMNKFLRKLMIPAFAASEEESILNMFNSSFMSAPKAFLEANLKLQWSVLQDIQVNLLISMFNMLSSAYIRDVGFQGLPQSQNEDPWSSPIHDLRTTLVLMILGKLLSDDISLQKIGGLDGLPRWVTSLLEDIDPRIRFHVAQYLQGFWMEENQDMYRQALQEVVRDVQATSDASILENPYLQVCYMKRHNLLNTQQDG